MSEVASVKATNAEMKQLIAALQEKSDKQVNMAALFIPTKPKSRRPCSPLFGCLWRAPYEGPKILGLLILPSNPFPFGFS